MSDIDIKRLTRALERIRDWRVKGPINEWSQAAAFGEVCEIASDALSPGLRAERIAADERYRSRLRAEVSALSRQATYFYRIPSEADGVGILVRFLRGSPDTLGCAYVRVFGRIGTPVYNVATFSIGEEFATMASNLTPLIRGPKDYSGHPVIANQ